jgi:hypothetical protein
MTNDKYAREVLRAGRDLGIGSLSSHYFGARVQRGAFINSQSFNDYRALTA